MRNNRKKILVYIFVFSYISLYLAFNMFFKDRIDYFNFISSIIQIVPSLLATLVLLAKHRKRSLNADYFWSILLMALVINFIGYHFNINYIVWICILINIALVVVSQVITNIENKRMILELKDLNENLEEKVRERTEEIFDVAFYDHLTNLPNQRLLKKRVKKVIHISEDSKGTVALMCLDLDRFKVINDTFGYSFGDSLLKEISTRIKQSVNENCTVFRQGGDRFTIIVEDILGEEQVIDIAKKILQKIVEPINLSEHCIYTTCSMGIAMYPGYEINYDTLIKRADIAMYHAKKQGRNVYCFYSHEMEESISKKLIIKRGLHKAIDKDEFVLHYQPQINIFTGQVVGVEALIRWNHPTQGLISPFEFIPMAEETGIIDEIGEWVLKTACKQTKKWHDMGFSELKIGVNISAHQFEQEDFVSIVKKVLEESQIQPTYLDLEITESIAMKNEVSVISKLKQLRSLGVTVSMDDFGTGYSSLSYLRNYPIDTLKIPREFIMDIKPNDNRCIIETIIAIAQKLELNIIAEGVETETQLEFLKSKDCTNVQGYLFSKPLEINTFENFYTATKARATVF